MASDFDPRKVELYHLIIAVLLCVGSMVSVYVLAIKDIETLKAQRKMDDEMTLLNNTKINYTLEKILEGQTRMLIQIENKQNRNNN